jgi:fructokinase
MICFGEVLWDIFPNQKKIGGAPLNVALRLNSLGVKTSIISRVGEDDLGRELLEFIKTQGLDSSEIQLDKNRHTGIVKVLLDKKGSATYTIEHPAAWDKIEISNKTIAKVENCDAFVFGSLVCRDPVSKNTLSGLLKYARFKVFDVNMRPPHFSMDLILHLMFKSDFIKCNDEELSEICSYLKFNSGSIKKQIQFISLKTNTKQICVTKGKEGAILLYSNKIYEQNGYPIKVADTVGAGDSFLAALISELIRKNKPEKALKFACAMGALVANKKGANPKIKSSELKSFIIE